MPLRITQQESNDRKGSANRKAGTSEHAERSETFLKVQGSLYLEDALLLEKICRDMRDETSCSIRLDLADLAFLDSDSASILCRLKREQHVELEGLHLFIAKVIELTEAEAQVTEYLPKAKQENQRTHKRSRLRAIR